MGPSLLFRRKTQNHPRFLNGAEEQPEEALQELQLPFARAIAGDPGLSGYCQPWAQLALVPPLEGMI